MDFKTMRKLLFENLMMFESLINHYDHYVDVFSVVTPEYRKTLEKGVVNTRFTLQLLPDNSEVLTAIYPSVMEAHTALKGLIKSQIELVEKLH